MFDKLQLSKFGVMVTKDGQNNMGGYSVERPGQIIRLHYKMSTQLRLLSVPNIVFQEYTQSPHNQLFDFWRINSNRLVQGTII